MVLVFIVVIGALVATLLAQATTNFRGARVSNAHQAKVYAANNALDWAVQEVRSDPTLCPAIGTSRDLTGVPAFNSRTVRVSCDGVAGGAAGVSGWTLFTTGTSGNTITVSCDAGFLCSSSPKRLVGPVYNNAAWNVNQEVTIQNGYVVQGITGGTCAPPTNVRFSPYVDGLSAGRFSCVARQTSADPQWTPGSTPPPSPWTLAELTGGGTKPGAAPAPTGDSSCQIWSPGTYSSMSFSGSSQNYLRSGVYVLDGAVASIPVGTRVVGGRPNNGSAAQVALTGACQTAQQGDAGNGVVFIMRGAARLDTLLGSFELHPFRPDPASDRPPISMYQLSVNESAAWGPPSAGAVPTNVIEVDDFSLFRLVDFGQLLNAKLALHGAVYAPRSGVDIAVYSNVQFPIAGGVVARTFNLSVGPFSGGDGEFGVSGGLANQTRTVDLTVYVEPSTPGSEKPILGHAQLIVSNDANRSVSVASWRIDEDTNVSTPAP